MKDKSDFMPADKPQRFLQIDTIILDACGQATQITQNNKFAMPLQYLKKEVLIFCIQINIKVSYKLISTLWASKFPTRCYYHY